MNTLKKWALGLALIVGGICGFVIASLDNNPATKPEVGKTVDQIKEGIDVIRKTEAPEEKTEVKTPAKTE